MPARNNHPLRVVPGLAASSLVHDRILSLCLIIALAAVIAPLLILLGLKYGTIETLRERLVEDPVYREIRPAQIYEFSPGWFDEVAGWPQVKFIVPSVLPLSSVLHVEHPHTGSLTVFDLISSGPGDPLLLENGAPAPEEGQCVLTHEASRVLGLEQGDILEARVTRTRGGRREIAASSLEVTGVLPPRAGSLPRIYAPLSFVLDIEAYKEGYGVPARGWKGDTPEPYLSYDGVLLLLPQPLDAIERTGLIINTGFARINQATGSEVAEIAAVTLPESWTAYRLNTPGNPATMSWIRALLQKLRGREHILLPYVQDIVLQDDNGKEIFPSGLSLSRRETMLLDMDDLPWGGFTGSSARGGDLTRILLSEPAEIPLSVSFQGVLDLHLDLKPAGTTALQRPVVPAELMGVLRTAMQRGVFFDHATREFSMARGGFRGFRLYTDSIDDVPGVYRLLQEQNIESIAQVETIERIQVLDSGLTRLYSLLALLGISGGTAVLLSSLYAAVERLRRDLGVLRLVGLGRKHVFFLPMIQGLIIAAAGLMLGFACYYLLAGMINHNFTTELAPGEKFCTLPFSYIGGIVVLTTFLALAGSLAAAWRATCIDPAEVIRDN